MEAKRYFGEFTSVEDVRQSFQIEESELNDVDVIFAVYETPSYEGNALVIYQRDGKLFEVHGSHCSCYGLEGQWEPEETTWEAIAMRPRYDGDIEPEASSALANLVNEPHPRLDF